MSSEHQLRNLVEQLSSLQFRRPSFSGNLEAEYLQESREFREKRLWMESSGVLCLYLVYVAADYTQDHSGRTILLFRCALPLLLVSLVVGLTWARRSKGPSELLLLVAPILAGSIEILSHSVYGSGGGHSHAAILAVLVITNTVLRLRPRYSMVALLWGLLSECAILSSSSSDHLREACTQAAFVSAIGFLTVVANYSQDREARLAFLKYAQKTEMVGSLFQQNQDLSLAAQTDSLTGLGNRSALDNCLLRLWSDPISSTTECSIIMADIDRFKNINDRYGHLYGDRVIKRVAHLLSEALRGEDDVIARYGGDEFVVILPRTSIQSALKVAERLRGLVELAGLPSLRSDDPSLHGLRATISCGVASGLSAVLTDPYLLLQAADEALYRAKRDGRNLVLERPTST